jgi:transposase-like protein
MEFPIVDLVDDDLSAGWLLKYFHPNGLRCPHCGSDVERAREFRQTKSSQLTVYRCNGCQGVYNLYSGTVFEGRHLRPAQVVLFLRGVCKGEPTATLAREIEIGRTTAHLLRQALQANAERLQPDTPLKDLATESDEMFQNAGEKGRLASQPG